MKKEMEIKLIIDYISDLHLDFYIGKNKNKEEFLEALERHMFILYPSSHKPGKILMLGGDISHHIHQIAWFIEYISQYYDKVFYVHGNHEMYLFEGESTYKEKLKLLSEELNKIDNCHYLNGDIVEYNGYKIGGSCLWYDFSYGIENFKESEADMLYRWKEYMHDSRKIKDGETEDYHVGVNGRLSQISFNTKKYFEEEYKKLLKLKECDIILSHVMPFVPKDYPKVYQIPESGFFSFDGREFISKAKVKYWVAGHTHKRIETKRYGVRMFINPAGYPKENWDKQIRQIVIKERV